MLYVVYKLIGHVICGVLKCYFYDVCIKEHCYRGRRFCVVVPSASHVLRRFEALEVWVGPEIGAVKSSVP